MRQPASLSMRAHAIAAAALAVAVAVAVARPTAAAPSASTARAYTHVVGGDLGWAEADPPGADCCGNSLVHTGLVSPVRGRVVAVEMVVSNWEPVSIKVYRPVKSGGGCGEPLPGQTADRFSGRSVVRRGSPLAACCTGGDGAQLVQLRRRRSPKHCAPAQEALTAVACVYVCVCVCVCRGWV